MNVKGYFFMRVQILLFFFVYLFLFLRVCFLGRGGRLDLTGGSVEKGQGFGQYWSR